MSSLVETTRGPEQGHWLIAWPGPSSAVDPELVAVFGEQRVELDATPRSPEEWRAALAAAGFLRATAVSLYPRALQPALDGLLGLLHVLIAASPELRVKLLLRPEDLRFMAGRRVAQALIAAGVSELCALPGASPDLLGRIAELPVLGLHVLDELSELAELKELAPKNTSAQLADWLKAVYPADAPGEAAATAETVLLPTGSSGNLAFATCAPGRPAFVKLRAPSEPGAPGRRDGVVDAASAEARIMGCLSTLPGFPRVLETRDGAAVTRFVPGGTSRGTRPRGSVALAMSLVPLRAAPWTEDLARALGRRVAEVHGCLVGLDEITAARPSGLQAWSARVDALIAADDLAARCERAPLLGTFRRQLPFFVAVREGARTVSQRPTCLCHGDLGLGNFWLGDDGRPVFVDFSDAKRDPPETDLARALLWGGVLQGALTSLAELETHIQLLTRGYAEGAAETSSGLEADPGSVRALLLLAYAFDLLSSMDYVNPADPAEQEAVFGPYVETLSLMGRLAGL